VAVRLPWERSEGKVQAWHRDRLAAVYVRQSTAAQVVDHQESTRLQYGLAERAVALGWAAASRHTDVVLGTVNTALLLTSSAAVALAVAADAGFVLAEGAEPVSGMDARFAKPRADRLIDHALQAAAMDGKLRHVVAGIEPARLAPDLLAEAVGVKQLIGADADRIEPFQEPERGKLLDRVRQRVDADAELAYLIGLLEDFAVDAARVQHQRGGKTADAAADDDDLHGGLLCQAGSAAQP